MLFSSITFLFLFLPIMLAVYYIAPPQWKNLLLLAGSLIFYAWGEPVYIILMILSILLNYFCGMDIENKSENEAKAKRSLVFAITVNIVLLVFFKYFGFLVESTNTLFGISIPYRELALPIGISFYTFQLISYIVDVYRGEAKVQKNIIKLATYISLFPQLIAGPIVRYTTIENQLENREYNMKNFSIGVRRFIIGLGKKVMIANVMGNLINIFLVSDEKSVLFYWLYAIALMIQIYFDFSGYSDMAIGLGKMLGFDFPENFNYPYIATSITDFWRRWHISLSSWFRDYIYIPLGGNRVSKLKWIRNIIIVWMLTGLWHGAEWNFVIWGLYFGVLLIIEKVFLLKWLQKIPKVISRIYTLFIVMISFIIFNGEGISTILENIGGLFKFVSIPLITNESMYYLKSYIIVIILGIIGATPICKNILTNEKLKKIVNILEPIYLLLIFIICTSYIVDGSFNPFLYFRF